MKKILWVIAGMLFCWPVGAQKAFVVGLDNSQIACPSNNTVPYFMAEVDVNAILGPNSSRIALPTGLSHACVLSDQPAGVAITRNGELALVTSSRPLAMVGTVAVIQANTRTACTPIPVGARPSGIAISPDGSRAYVANGGDGTISVIDLNRISDWCSNLIPASDLFIGSPIPVGGEPRGVAISPDGSLVFITDIASNTVSVINIGATGFSVLGPYLVGTFPWGVDISRDGQRAYVANWGSHTISVIDIGSIRSNPGLDPVIDHISLTMGNFTNPAPQGIVVSPNDPNKVFVVNQQTNTVAIVDMNSSNQVRHISPPASSILTGGIDITPDGSRVLTPASGTTPAKLISFETSGSFNRGEVPLNFPGRALRSAGAFGKFISGHSAARMDTLDRLFDVPHQTGFPTCCIDEFCVFASGISTPTFGQDVSGKVVQLRVRPEQNKYGHITGRIFSDDGMVFNHYEDVHLFQVRLDYGRTLNQAGEVVNDFIDLDLRDYDGILLKFGSSHSVHLGTTVMVFTDAPASVPIANSLGKSIPPTALEARFEFRDFFQGNTPLDLNDLEHSRIIVILMNAAGPVDGGQLALESVVLYKNP